MANEKIIAQDVFQQAIKDILTELVNSTYQWESYSDEEIGNLVELDPTQVAELTKVINDGIASKNHVYSSAKTKELIQQSVIESNQYADSLVADLANIGLDIVDALPSEADVNKSTIYILKDSTGGTNNTLNVWSSGTNAFVEVGKFSIDLSTIYTKTEVDNLLADKANADSVVTPDDIVQNLDTTSGTTVLSSAGLQTELDKKFDKSGILSSISTTPSDEKVLSEKAIKTELDKKIDLSKIKKIPVTSKGTSLNDFKSDDETILVGSGTAWENQTTDMPSTVGGAYVVIWFPYSAGDYGIQILKAVQHNDGRYRVFSRSIDNGNWSNWKQLLDEDEITTTINHLSTDTQVPSAKAVHDSKYYNTFGLKCPLDQSPLDFVIENTTANMIIRFDSWGNSTSGRVAPWASYIGIKHRDTGDVSLIGINNLGVYKINTYADGAWSGWRTVCTTKVDDVGETAITTTNSNLNVSDSYYVVQNGICYVSLWGIKSSALKTQIVSTSLPKSKIVMGSSLCYDDADGTTMGNHGGCMYIYRDGTLRVDVNKANVKLYGSFSYPVAE